MKITTADLLHALVTYNEIVHDNAINTPDRDILVQVAEDPHGEVGYEISETGQPIPLLDEDGNPTPWSELLWKFAALYKDCIAQEIAERPVPHITGDQRDCIHLDDLTVGELEVLRLDPGRRFELPCPVCVVDKIRDRTKGAMT